MNPLLPGLWAVFLVGSLLTAAASESDAVRQGTALAESLRGQRPGEDLSWRGVFKVRDARGVRHEIAAQLIIHVTPTNWQVVYATRAAAGPPSHWLRILRRDTGPNHYELGCGPALPEPGVPPGAAGRVLEPAELMRPFADTDFWIADLGLEFLFWPSQRLLKKEMIRGQFCHVLESVHPAPAAEGYARVVSWIDTDTQGIVYAEAYDLKGQRVKEFAPKRFSKVNGQWQVREIEIRNLRTGSRTRLEFALADTP